MITVALVGAEGSGKTALSDSLVLAIENQDPKLTVAVVDDYAQAAGDRVDHIVGFYGDYITNVSIAVERIGIERKSADNDVVITAGTLLENSVYTAMQFERQQELQDDDAVRQDTMRRVEATLKMLACFYMDSFHYDLVFYLPPIVNPDEQFEKNLQASFQAFSLTPVIPLNVGGSNPEEITDNRTEVVIDAMFPPEETIDEGNDAGSGDTATEADGS